MVLQGMCMDMGMDACMDEGMLVVALLVYLCSFRFRLSRCLLQGCEAGVMLWQGMRACAWIWV